MIQFVLPKRYTLLWSKDLGTRKCDESSNRFSVEECRRCSELRHPNVTQFLGIYYGEAGQGAGKMQLPIMVMEMMVNSLTVLVEKHNKIPIHIKFSIVHDVSLGLSYLHNHGIIHQDLSSNKILLTIHHVAKISDLVVSKVIGNSRKRVRNKVPDFMAPLRESQFQCPHLWPSHGYFLICWNYSSYI